MHPFRSAVHTALRVFPVLALFLGAQVAMAAPSITSLGPGSGVVGATITITGTNFSATPSANNVKFNGTAAATPTSATTTQLVVTVPPFATSGPVSVTVASQTGTSARNFLVVPSITGFSPAGGPAGTAVTISGWNFSDTSANNEVRFNGTLVFNNTSSSTTQIVASVPSGATTGPITIRVNGGVSATSSTNFVVGSLPTISTFTPSGPVGSSVTITGTNFSATATNDAVFFNGTAATITSVSTTQLIAVVPAGATTGKIRVTVSGALSVTSAGDFTVTAPPVQPTCSSAAPQTATVAVNATTQRVYAYGVQNATTVQFPTWWLPGHQSDIQWLNGTNAGSGTWYADVPLSQFDAGNPRYGDFKTDVYMSNSAFANVFCAHTFWAWTFPAPTVSSFTPSFGPIYSTVTINGANFSSTLAEDIVTFNGQPAAVTAASATQLTVAVPSGATSGPISLTINGQTVNVGYFTLAAFNYDGSLFENACQLNDPKILSVLQSEAFLVQRSILTQNPDGTYKLTSQPYTSYTDALGSGPLPLDMSSLFYGDPQATAGRSAFLIGPSLMMTAPHAASSGANAFDVSQFAVVFGMSPGLVNGSSYQTYVCQFPSFASIPAANVYFPDMTRPVINTWTSTTPTYDYEAFYLTQSPNRPYVRLRRSGGAYSGDPAAEIGHPERLTTKISPAVELFGVSSGTLLLNGGHSLEGSSGSMIYNLAHDYVEVAVQTGGCAHYQLVNGGPNSKMVLGCSSINYSVNYPVADVASGIPAFSLITSPESDVVEQIAVGGTASTTYTLAAPTTASAPISWQIAAPTGHPAGAPAITFAPATTSGTLALGSSYQFVANVGSANTCGKFDETFKVYDNTNGFTDSLTHHIEVGLTEFAVTPSDGFALQKMLPPYNGVAKTYALSNPRPTAVSVRVSSANWVDLSYQQGSLASVPSPTPIVITLGPAGSSTATANVFVRVDETLGEAFTPGVEVDATVTFANTSTTCAVTMSTSRTVQFTPGKQEYDKVDPTLPDVWAGTIDETISVPDNFVIGAVAVDVGLYNSSQISILDDFTHEQIVLISPAGQRLTLWDRNAAPMGNYYSVGFNADANGPVGTLHIDDTLSPSPVGTHLSALQGQSATGTWTLEITGSGGGASFADWALRFTLLYCPNCQ